MPSPNIEFARKSGYNGRRCGQRVYCKFPASLVWRATEPQEFEGEIIGEGYRSDQWKVRPDYTDKIEMIHESFISVVEMQA